AEFTSGTVPGSSISELSSPFPDSLWRESLSRSKFMETFSFSQCLAAREIQGASDPYDRKEQAIAVIWLPGSLDIIILPPDKCESTEPNPRTANTYKFQRWSTDSMQKCECN
ncbi:hypothetical protein STEG23_038182, partial [Scotinomys teguina]